MSIESLKSISTQKAHKTCYKQGSILYFLGTNQFVEPTVRHQKSATHKKAHGFLI